MLGPQAEAEKPPMNTARQARATAEGSFSGSFTSHIIGGVLVMTTSPAAIEHGSNRLESKACICRGCALGFIPKKGALSAAASRLLQGGGGALSAASDCGTQTKP